MADTTYNNFYQFLNDYKKHNPNGHYFDSATLKFFGERTSDMYILKNTTMIKNFFPFWNNEIFRGNVQQSDVLCFTLCFCFHSHNHKFFLLLLQFSWKMVFGCQIPKRLYSHVQTYAQN